MTKFLRLGFAALLCAMLSAAALAQKKPCPPVEANVADARFKPGQVWTYTTRPNEPSSTLTILQVDRTEKLGVIVHIRLDDLQMHNPRGEVVSTSEHLPFTRDAMLTSTEHLVRTEKKIPSLEGYEVWRHDCGGAYTISVRDAVDVMQKTFDSGTPTTNRERFHDLLPYGPPHREESH